MRDNADRQSQRLPGAALLAVFAVVAFACGGGNPAARVLPPRPDPSTVGDLLPDTVIANGPYKLAISYPTFDFPFFTQGVHYGAVQECKRLKKVTCIFTFGAGYDKCDIQISDMENLIVQGPDGINLTACADEALIPVMDKAAAKGIVVTSFSIPSASKTYYGYEGISHHEAGKVNTEVLLQCLKEKGLTGGKIIAIAAAKGASFAEPRVMALNEVLSANPGFKLAGFQYAPQQTREATQTVFENLLTANPDAVGAWTFSGDQAMGIITVLKNRGFKPGQVCVVAGGDFTNEYAQAIKDGWYYGNVTQQAVITGQQAIRKLVAHLNRDPNVPFYIREPFALVTKQNVDTIDRSTFIGPADFVPPAKVLPQG